MVSLVLTFGIFFALSCSTIENTEIPQQESSPQHTYDQQLRDLNNQISQSPGDTHLHEKKAELLFDYATSFSTPQQRLPLYANLHDLSGEDRSNQKINSIIKKAWSSEHSSGIRLLQQDESNEFVQQIIAHFDNAITLIPDTLVTYSLKAATLYENGNLHSAIETLETAKAKTGGNEEQLDEKIAYLNLESGNLQEAVLIYHSLTESNPDNEHYKHGLINAMIINEQHEDVISILRRLSEEFPARIAYQEALATETFFFVKKESEYLLLSDPESSDISGGVATIISYLEEAHTIFNSLSSQVPLNEENTLRLAAFYKNSATIIGTLANELPLDDDKKEELEIVYIDFLEQSLPSWERLSELNPDNIDYLLNLKQVYEYLGMDEESEAVERSLTF